MLEATESLGLLPSTPYYCKKPFIVQDIINIRNSSIHLFFPLTFFNSLDMFKRYQKYTVVSLILLLSCHQDLLSKGTILSISYIFF